MFRRQLVIKTNTAIQVLVSQLFQLEQTIERSGQSYFRQLYFYCQLFLVSAILDVITDILHHAYVYHLLPPSFSMAPLPFTSIANQYFLLPFYDLAHSSNVY